jgi:hypothetical protein
MKVTILFYISEVLFSNFEQSVEFLYEGVLSQAPFLHKKLKRHILMDDEYFLKIFLSYRRLVEYLHAAGR